MANPSGTPRNLRRFPKGRSGNPGGRPKGTSLTAALRAELDKPVAPGSPVTNREKIASMLVELAARGDLAAIREILDRTEGKAVQRQEQGDPGDFLDLSDVDTDALKRAIRRLK